MTQNQTRPRFGGTPVSSGPRFGGTLVEPLDRSIGERFRDNISEGFWRSQLGALRRAADPGQDGLFDIRDVTAVRYAPLLRELDRRFGEDRDGWFEAAPRTYETLGETFSTGLRGAGLAGTEAAAEERRRRQRFEERAALDPVRNPGDALASFGGQLVGGAPSPENFAGGGAGRGLSLVPRLMVRAGEQAGIAGLVDVSQQRGDIASGIQDRYSPTQTLMSAGAAGVLGPAFDVGAPVVGRAAGTGARAAARFGGQLVEQPANYLRGVLANPLPDFSGRGMDAGAMMAGEGTAAPPLRRPGGANPASAVQRRQIPIPEAFRPAFSRASQETGVSVDYLGRLARRESSFNPSADAPTSSARGLFQFTERTWLNTLRRHGDRLGMSDAAARIEADPAGVLRLRDNPELSARAAALLTQDNAASLRRALGREPTPAELYSAHFLGEGGARRLATADPEARASDLFPDAAAANRSIFYVGARPRSVAEVRAKLAEGFDGAAGIADIAEAPRSRVTEEQSLYEPRDPAEVVAVERRPEPAPGLTDLGIASPEGGLRRPREQQLLPEPNPLERPRTLAAMTEATANRPAPRFGRQAVEVPEVSPSARFGSPDRLAVDLSGYSDRIGQSMPSSGQTISGLREAPRPQGVARSQGAEFAGRTVSDLAADLRNTLGLTHRQGRVSMKRALGTYDTGSGVVRTKAVDELDVLAHEATHALEYERKGPALTAALKAHRKELESLAYPGAAPGSHRQEGFAEFGRWYLTNPDHARRVAPAFYDAFERALEADAPEVLAGMRAIQGGYQNLLSSASIDVARGSIAYTGSKGPVGNFVEEVRRKGPASALRRVFDSLYTAVVDDLHPIAIAERELSKLYLANTGQRLDLKRAASPYALGRLSREAYAAGHNDLMNGVTPYHGLDPEGPSLADALETAGLERGVTGKFKHDATREFDAYLIARRMVHEWDRYGRGELPNPPDRNTRQFHEQVIADAEAAHPTWREAAGQVYGFLENLWRKEFEAGLITRESYEHGLTAHPDYVPLMRDMSDKGPGRAGKPRGALQFAGGVKAFEGSSRDIISPLSSIMRRSYELNAIIRRNDTMLALDDLAQRAGRGAGAFVERLPAKEIEAVNVDAEQALRKAAEEMGLSGRDLSTMQKFADDAAADDLTLTVFKQSEFSPRKGEAVVFVWRGGKKTPLLLADGELGQEMFQALTGLNRDLRNIAVDVMAAGTQLLRYGVTLSPEFMGANLVRDALATWINTDVGFIPGVDTIRGGVAEVSQGRTAQRYATAGGMRGGANVAATSKPFPKTDAEAEAQLQHLRRRGWKVRRFASWRGLAEATDLSETSTRLGVFSRAFDKAKSRGASDYEALIEAGFTSRDYLDFGRRGSKMVTASRLVTFLNAAMQGLDKSARVLTAGGDLRSVLVPDLKGERTPAKQAAVDHARKAWAKVAMLGAVGLGLRMLYADDPEYQEINDRLRATHWVFRSEGSWIFIPKPFELATLSNILERAVEGTVLRDPTAGERLLSDFRHTIAPPSEIPALAVPFHLAKNRDYLGRPIVPDHLKGTVDPEQQYTAFTSDLGKLIGRTFGLSPAQVDYVITGFGGSLGRYVQQASNLVGEAITGRPRTSAGLEDTFLARRFIRQIDRGATSQAEFWDQVSRDGGEMVRAEGTFRGLMRDQKDAEATAYLNGLDPEDRAYVLAKVFSEDGSSRDHPMIRAQGVVSVLGDFRRSLRDGSLLGSDGRPISLTPGQRRTIDNAMADMAMAEMRNALIETGVKGWTQKQPMDTLAPAETIGRTSPEVAAQLQAWLAQSRSATIFHPQELAASRQRWSMVAQSARSQIDAVPLSGAMQRERLSSGSRLDRYREGQRVRGLMTGGQSRQTPAGPGLMTGSAR